jgi:hypothetical protein
VRSGEQLQDARLTGSAGTQWPRLTCRAVGQPEMHGKPGISSRFPWFPPREGPFALRTAHLLTVPIYQKVFLGVGPSYLGLPARLRTRGAN